MMQENPGSRNLLKRKLSMQSESPSQNAVLIRSSPKRSSSNITASEEILLSIHKKIHMHLQETKPLSKYEVRKLTLILNRLACSTPRQATITQTAQDILRNIYEQYTSNDSPNSNNSRYFEGDSGQAANASARSCSVGEEDSTNITTTKTLHQHSPPNVFANTSTTFNTQSLPENDWPNNEINQEFVEEINMDSSFHIDQDLSNNKENIPFHSQGSNVIKLRFDHVTNDDGSLSFPLELLTNTDFKDTQKKTDSGTPINRSSNQHPENTFLSNITDSELGNLIRDTISESANDTIHITDQLISTESEICLQPNLNCIDMDVEINTTDENSDRDLFPKSANNLEENNVNLNYDDVKISKNICVDTNNVGNVIPSLESLGTLTSNIEELVTQSQILNLPDSFGLPSERSIWGHNLNISSATHTTPSILNIETVTSNGENQGRISQFSYSKDIFEMPSEGSVWEKGNIRISEATEHNLNNSNVPEIISVDSDRTNSEVENLVIDDDFMVTDAEKTVFHKNKQQHFDNPCRQAVSDKPNDITKMKNPKIKSPSIGQPKIIKPITNMPEVLSETPEIIIDETQHVNSESAIFKNNPKQKYGVSSPFKNRKKVSLSRRSYSKNDNESHFDIIGTPIINRSKQHPENTFISNIKDSELGNEIRDTVSETGNDTVHITDQLIESKICIQPNLNCIDMEVEINNTDENNDRDLFPKSANNHEENNTNLNYNHVKISKNIRLDSNNAPSLESLRTLTSNIEELVTQSQILNLPDSFGLPSEISIWGDNLNISSATHTTPYILNIETVTSKGENKGTNQTFSCLKDIFEMPSEGSVWEKGNIKISEATEYNLNDSNVPEIISVDSDRTNSEVENLVIDDDFVITDAEKTFLELVSKSTKTTPTRCKENVLNKTPTINNSALPTEHCSFEFNLQGLENIIGFKDSTILTDKPSDITRKENPKIKSPSMGQPKIIEPITNITDVISETPEIIIDETQHVNSESAIFKNYPKQKYGVSSPFKNRIQSSSFLNYKSSGKSAKNLSVSLSRRSYSKNDDESHFDIIECNPDQGPSENITLINGAIPTRVDAMESNSMAAEEEPFSEKQKELQKKVMQKRNKYRAKWKDMPITEKLSAKFADKFRVRIFEDPVGSLENIDYKPDFNCFHFPRLTIKELHEQLQSSWETAKIMDTALGKVIGKLAEKNSAEVATSCSVLRNCSEQSDSNSSDEELEPNKKWLKAYYMRKTTEHGIKKLIELMHEDSDESEENIRNMEQSCEHENEDTDKLLEDILRRMGDNDWLKE